MISFVANVLVIIALGLLVLRRGRDQRVQGIANARWLRIAALIPLALQVAIFLMFGLGEMSGGDFGGAGHLLQLALTILQAILCWLRPLEGGIALDATGTVSAAYFITSTLAAMPSPELTAISPALLIIAAPQIISGALFFSAGILGRRATTQGMSR